MPDNAQFPQNSPKRQNNICRSQALSGWRANGYAKPTEVIGDRTGFFGNILINFTQILIRIISRVLVPLIAKVDVQSQEWDDTDIKPLIFISNHKSYYDSLLIAYSFPFFSRIFPLRFITWDRFFQNFFTRMLFKSMGSYPAYYGQGIDKSLQTPFEIIKKKGAVVFFIEGSCFRDDVLHPPKPGTAILALRCPEAKILPFAIKGSYQMDKLFNRPKVGTSIGKPFYLRDKIDITKATSDQISELLMNEIARLYNNIK